MAVTTSAALLIRKSSNLLLGEVGRERKETGRLVKTLSDMPSCSSEGANLFASLNMCLPGILRVELFSFWQSQMGHQMPVTHRPLATNCQTAGFSSK
ncbi:hypothetical protein [uncultured Pseudomonas sp.]|uniref:hypothetical protein n=1 Tax=Pseudomonas sp. 18175 TaxID=3390056 RepID=UPI0028D0BF56|nr:hypothetical protein [uncultured Pseudomonas sp.]